MRQNIPIEDLSTEDWVSHATLGLATSVLEERCGLHFYDGYDDLDLFRGTKTFSVDGKKYMLRHYRGDPRKSVDVYLPFKVDDPAEIAKTVDAVLNQLRLSRNIVIWERYPPRYA